MVIGVVVVLATVDAEKEEGESERVNGSAGGDRQIVQRGAEGRREGESDTSRMRESGGRAWDR